MDQGRHSGGQSQETQRHVADVLADVELFYGELSPQRALIYARVPRDRTEPGDTLSGQVRGPKSRYAQTLPVAVPLVDMGPGPTLLAKAMLVDPCYWLPETPLVYDVIVTLRRDGQPVASAQRLLALRPLGVVGDRLKLAGKTYVLRGVWRTSSEANAVHAWRETQAALVLPDVSLTPAELCAWLDEALWCGVPVAVCLASEAPQTRLAWLAQHPAVSLVVLPAAAQLDFAPSELAPNLLVAQRLTGPHEKLAPWAQLAWIEAENVADVLKALPRTLPVVVQRKLSRPVAPEQARAACDALQRDLAPLGPLAGFVV